MGKKVIVLFCIIVLTNNCSGIKSGPSITRTDVQRVINHSPQSNPVLPTGTHKGCVTVPGSAIQRAMVGFKFTGEECSFSISSSNKVSVSFLGNTNIQVHSTGQRDIPKMFILQNWTIINYWLYNITLTEVL